jgi:hypothetical protein
MVKYLFPEDIFKYVFTFLPQHYKKPPHLIAINTNELFADSLAFGYNHGWQNSFMNYKKWSEFINSY